MLGNMQAESALRANNVQDGYGYTDEGYTAKVDSGQLNFIDSIGYGLCQWTYGPRKLKLLQFARQRGVSIGDEAMQVDFCVNELRTEYPKLWLYLCDCKGVYQAAEKICKEYERPAVNNVDVRAKAADSFYMSYGGMSTTPLSPTEPTERTEAYWPPRTLAYGMHGSDVVALQGLLLAHGYELTVDGQYGNDTKRAVEAFQKAQSLKVDGIAGNKTWTKLTAR